MVKDRENARIIMSLSVIENEECFDEKWANCSFESYRTTRDFYLYR